MPRTILHVDEDPRLPERVPETLAEEGFTILQTADPEETIRRVGAGELALVLIEIDLEHCDGPDLLRGIREAAPDLPVIVVSRTERSSGIHGEAIALGVHDFLSKPVLASQLLGCIHEVLPPPAEEPKPDEATRAEPAGDLAETPLIELLARLRRRGGSGVLLAGHGKARIGVQVRNGSPVAVSTKGMPPAESAEAALSTGIGWETGSYRYEKSGKLRADTALAITRDPASLLFAGALEAAPEALVADRLRKRAGLYVSAAEVGDETLEGLELTEVQERVLAELRGDCTLEELIEAGTLEGRLLYALWAAGRILFHAAPALSLLDDLVQEKPRPAPVPEAPAAAPRAASATPPAASAPAPAAPAPPAAAPAPRPAAPVPPSAASAPPRREPEPPVEDHASLVATVRELAQQVMYGDEFEALDIPVFATDAQVRGAYERVLARIPEAALRSDDAELRERAVAIRERAEAAYEHLKDPETRRGYAVLTREEEQDRSEQASADRALEAERWFRKGKACLESRRYEEAAEAFGMASHLDAEEGEYRAHLGYALFLCKPKDGVVQREAMEHIASGIKRSPGRELSYVYLGRILRARGEIETARKVFRRALRINRSCHPAQQELRLLEIREQKGKGLFSRLLGR